LHVPGGHPPVVKAEPVPVSGPVENHVQNSSLPPNVEQDSDGSLYPKPGYMAVNPKSSLSVKWHPGIPYMRFGRVTNPHISASELEGHWHPYPGYEWVGQQGAGNWSVRWAPGVQCLDNERVLWPHVIADDKEGDWRPEPDYEWARLAPNGGPPPGNLAVVPIGDPRAPTEKRKALQQHWAEYLKTIQANNDDENWQWPRPPLPRHGFPWSWWAWFYTLAVLIIILILLLCYLRFPRGRPRGRMFWPLYHLKPAVLQGRGGGLETLSKSDNPHVIPLLVRRIKNEYAPMTLIKIGKPAVEQLIKLLRSRFFPSSKGEYAISVLEKIADPGSAALLVGLLKKSAYASNWSGILRVLAAIGQPSVEPLAAWLRENSGKHISLKIKLLKEQIVDVLKKMHAVQPLADLLKREISADELLETIGMLEDKNMDWPRLLVEALLSLGWHPKDIDEEIVVYIVNYETIQKISNEAVDRVIAALQYPNYAVQTGAAIILERLAEPKAVVPLIAVAVMDDGRLGEAARSAVERIRLDAVVPLTIALTFSKQEVKTQILEILESIDRNIDKNGVSDLNKILTNSDVIYLTSAIQNKNVSVQMAAVKVLSYKNKNTQVIALLEEAMKGPEYEVKRNVLEILEKIDGNGVSGLAMAIKDSDIKVRLAAMQILGRKGKNAQVIALLEEVLKDHNLYVRLDAAQALVRYNETNPPVVAALKEALKYPTMDGKLAASNVIIQMRDPDLTASLAEFVIAGMEDIVKNGVSGYRSKGLEIIRQIREFQDNTLLEKLTECVKEECGEAVIENLFISSISEKKKRILEILKTIDKDSVKGMRAALKDADQKVRLKAVDAPADNGDPRAMDLVLETLRDVDNNVRQSAGKTLGGIADQRAEEAQRQAEEEAKQIEVERIASEKVSTERKVAEERERAEQEAKRVEAERVIREKAEAERKAAEAEIDKIKVAAESRLAAANNALVSAKSNRQRKRSDWNAKCAEADIVVYEKLQTLLIQAGDDASASTLLAGALHDPDANVRRKAIKVLASIGEQPAIEVLLEALRDTDNGVQHTAERALRESADPRAMDILLTYLVEKFHNEDSRVRLEALGALGDIGSPRALDSFLTALHDKDYEVRYYARHCLIYNEKYIKPLIAYLPGMLLNESPNVREAGIGVLGELQRALGHRLLDYPGVMDLLICALSGKDNDVMNAAANILALYYKTWKPSKQLQTVLWAAGIKLWPRWYQRLEMWLYKWLDEHTSSTPRYSKYNHHDHIHHG
jgi:HEAT repeat protein